MGETSCRWCGYDLSAHLSQDEFTCPECGGTDSRGERAIKTVAVAWSVWVTTLLIVPQVFWWLSELAVRGVLWGWMERTLGRVGATTIAECVVLGAPVACSILLLVCTAMAARALKKEGRRGQAAVVRTTGLLIAVIGGLAWLGFGVLTVMMRRFPLP
jgi:hypothetical protein